MEEEKHFRKHLKKISKTFTFSNLDFDRQNPDEPISWSTLPTHTAPQLVIEGWRVSGNAGGYALCRLSHGFSEGHLSFEIACMGEVRLGVAQILAEAQAPVGYDEYGYGLRVSDGALVHASHLQPGETSHSHKSLIVKVDLHLTEQIASQEALADWESRYPPLRLGEYKVKQELLEGANLLFQGKDSEGELLYERRFDCLYRAKYYPAVSLYGPHSSAQLLSLYHNNNKLV